MAWFGFVWYGLVLFGMVWFGLVWYSLDCFGIKLCRGETKKYMRGGGLEHTINYTDSIICYLLFVIIKILTINTILLDIFNPPQPQNTLTPIL